MVISLIGSLIRCRAEEMGISGLQENVDVLQEEMVALGGFINPTSNFAEMDNADFWRRVGGKRGGYLTRGQVVQTLANRAVMQIARRVEFERTGLVGTGPGVKEMQMRAESRKRSLDQWQRGLDTEELDRERPERVKRTSGVGMGDPVSRVLRGGEEGGMASERSTHRHDQRRVERRSEGLGYKGLGRKIVDLNEAPEEEVWVRETVVERQAERWAELAPPTETLMREEETMGGEEEQWMQREESEETEIEERVNVQTWEEKDSANGDEVRMQGENR